MKAFNLKGVQRVALAGCALAWAAMLLLPDAAATEHGRATGGSAAHPGPLQPARSTPPATALQPPKAAQRPHTVKSPHGDRDDPYYWLRDDDPRQKRPEVMAYLEAEQAYTQAWLAPHAALKQTLLDEMRARIASDDSSAPFYDNGYWYWQRFAAGAEYPVQWRRKGTPAAPDAGARDEVLLDRVDRAKGQAFYSVGDWAVSPDNRYLALTEDTQGRGDHTLRVRDLATGQWLSDAVTGVTSSIVWANDSRTVFYLQQNPQTLQAGPVMRHALGTAPDADAQVYAEPDDTLFLGIGRTASREFITISSSGFDTAALRVLPADRPTEAPRVLLPARHGVLSHADHWNGRWIIRTNDGARNFRLVDGGADPADASGWRDLMPGRQAESLEDFALFAAGIVVQERVAANPRLRVLSWQAADAGRVVPTRETVYAMSLEHNPDPAALAVRYRHTSMVQPARTIDYRFADGALEVRKVDPVPTYDASRYRAERLWATARDGQRVPLSMVYRADRYRRDGRSPMLITGYGAYGYSQNARLNRAAVSLLDRGFALVVAHVRGGADLGRSWYEDGRLLAKRNSFNDFEDATRWLLRERYAAPGRVFAEGGSAGGLLMGAVANQAGSLYRGITLQVPFVDVLTTMLDETIPLTTNEWAQWGNPKLPGVYDYIRSYSPYDNIARKPYPAMFVRTGLWDSQVAYFEPAKYVARLRERKTDREPLLLSIDMHSGHGGKSGRYAALDEAANIYTFYLALLQADASAGTPRVRR